MNEPFSITLHGLFTRTMKRSLKLQGSLAISSLTAKMGETESMVESTEEEFKGSNIG